MSLNASLLSGLFSGVRSGLNPSVGGSAAAMPTFQAVGTESVADSITALDVAWPAHAENDIGILWVAGLESVEYAAPAGWTQCSDSPQKSNGAAFDVWFYAFWKRAASGAEANAVVADVGGDDHKIGIITTFRGCAASGSPFDVTAGDANTSESTVVTAPGDTTTGANRLVVVGVGHCAIDSTSAQFSAWANADLANVTERADVCTTNSIGYGIGVATGEKAAAGAFGATTATLATAVAQARITLTLKG